MTNEHEGLTTIEVNGVKLEVGLRTARRVEELRVGDRVKVLTKTYEGHKVHPGVVIGFEPFPELPTIVVAYLNAKFSEIKLEFLHFNAQTKDTGLIKAVDDDPLDLDRENVERFFDREVAKNERAIMELNEKREYFRRHFRAYWAQVAPRPEPEVHTAKEPDLFEAS